MAGLITPFVLKHFQTDFPEKQSQESYNTTQQMLSTKYNKY